MVQNCKQKVSPCRKSCRNSCRCSSSDYVQLIMNALTIKAGGSPATAAATATVVTIASLAALHVTISRLSRSDHVNRESGTRKSYIASPLRTQIPNLTPTQIAELPYPPEGALPGGRDVETAYGSIRVYEWGPETGEKVLFVHGISTPCIALGDLGWELVRKGYRVMLFGEFCRSVAGLSKRWQGERTVRSRRGSHVGFRDMVAKRL